MEKTSKSATKIETNGGARSEHKQSGVQRSRIGEAKECREKSSIVVDKMTRRGNEQKKFTWGRPRS